MGGLRGCLLPPLRDGLGLGGADMACTHLPHPRADRGNTSEPHSRTKGRPRAGPFVFRFAALACTGEPLVPPCAPSFRASPVIRAFQESPGALRASGVSVVVSLPAGQARLRRRIVASPST